jgi:hypothetical protein
MSTGEWIPPCNFCGRTHDQTPLRIDYKNRWHQCVDALSCLREIKAKGAHTFHFGTSTLGQRRLAVNIAAEKGIDVHQLIVDELGLNDMLEISGKALSVIIDGMISRQIKGKRAA